MFSKIFEFLKKELSATSLAIDESSFKTLEKECKLKVHAIDGGCSIIFDGSTWNISRINIAHIAYQGNKRVIKEIEAYTLVLVQKNGRLIHYLDPYKEGFMMPGSFRQIDEAPNLARSLLEWLKLKEVASSINEGELILRDGPISAVEPEENVLVESVVNECKLHNVPLIGLCKTSKATDGSGRPIIGMLKQWAPQSVSKSAWMFQNEDLTAVKLHPNSRIIYRLESTISQDSLRDALSSIVSFSRDPEILGYPYPLLKVDKLARMQSSETKRLNNLIRLYSRRYKLPLVEADETACIMHKLMDERAYRVVK